jgi:hypothetical protein
MTIQSIKTKLLILFFILLNCGILVLGTFGGFYLYEGYKEKLAREKNISAAQAPDPVVLTMDYSKQISTGSPLIFGGAHYPPVEHTMAWDKLTQVGVTSIRVDLALERLFPANEKLDEKEFNAKKRVFIEAQKRGLTIIAIMDYAPRWLTYTGTEYGVPKDMEVYKQLVSKAYEQYRPYIDYLEIWNEPNMINDKLFLIPTGSGLTRIEAYEKIYLNAATAIREVDKNKNDGKLVPIGAQVSFTSADATFLAPLLANPEIKPMVDFVSYHQYEPVPSNSIFEFKKLTEQYGVPDMPIFLTEWSYSSKGSSIEAITTKPAGIWYATKMLMNYFKMGLAGANYHTVTALEYNKPYGLERNHAFYIREGNNIELLPLAKAWFMLSKTLKLGAGNSQIFETESAAPGDIETLGFINASGEQGMAILNTSENATFIELTVKYPEQPKWSRASVFQMTERTDVPKLLQTQILKPKENAVSIKMYVAASSITGILLKQDVSYPEQLRYDIIYR